LEKKFILFLFLAVLLSACGSVSQQAAPTYTPYPTYTPSSPSTPYPTYTPFPPAAATAERAPCAEAAPCVTATPEAWQQEALQLAERLRPTVVLIQAYTLEPVTGRLLEGWHGTGFLISADGYIATAAHNLAGAAVVKVMLFGETDYIPAKVLAYLSDQDIGVVKIEATGMPFAEFGDSDSLVAGDHLMAIGHPGSLRWGVHVGPFLRLDQVDNFTVPMILSKVPSGAGQRGGPVFNMAGQVIGSVTVMAPENIDQILAAEELEIAADLCYSDGHEHSQAIPSNAIRQFVEAIMAR